MMVSGTLGWPPANTCRRIQSCELIMLRCSGRSLDGTLEALFMLVFPRDADSARGRISVLAPGPVTHGSVGEYSSSTVAGALVVLLSVVKGGVQDLSSPIPGCAETNLHGIHKATRRRPMNRSPQAVILERKWQ